MDGGWSLGLVTSLDKLSHQAVVAWKPSFAANVLLDHIIGNKTRRKSKVPKQAAPASGFAGPV